MLVLPKIDHPLNHYAMPIKLGEYLASGRPTVCAEIGGIRDVIQHDVNGLLYPPGNVEAMRLSISSLLNDTKKAKRIGKMGQKTAFENLDVSAVGRQLSECLLKYE